MYFFDSFMLIYYYFSFLFFFFFIFFLTFFNHHDYSKEDILFYIELFSFIKLFEQYYFHFPITLGF